MRIYEIQDLLCKIKQAIQSANDRGDFHRVAWLKIKRFELRKKITEAKTKPNVKERILY